MKTVKELLISAKNYSIYGDEEIAINELQLDNRKIRSGNLFVALKGLSTDGHLFIPAAIEKGATAILCNNIPESKQEAVVYIVAEDCIAVLASICAEFFNHPLENLQLIGVTGTNGKTSVATMLWELFGNLGHRCGLISTVENKIGYTVLPSTHTTPDIISVYRLLASMRDAECNYCFMEVSSHAVHQRRIEGLQFAAGIFTNITHDHLDYHGTFANYIAAKKLFFDQLPSDAYAITNKDDKNGQVMLQNTKASRYTYGMHGTADFSVKILESDFNGTLLQIAGQEIWVHLVGEFNAYNIAAVYACAFLLTQGEENLGLEISKLKRVAGRFEAVQTAGISGIVDYAHTPDALENVLKTIIKIRSGASRIITVVGCGGDRDTTKRPEMGKIAAQLSDTVILTSDNPRSESPEIIINQMEAGVEGQHYKKMLKITNRREAIKTAVMLANTGDVILVAGKGHENYQEINGVKEPFDDKTELYQLLKTKNQC